MPRTFSRQVLEGIQIVGDQNAALSYGMAPKWYRLRCSKRVSKLISIRLEPNIETMVHVEWMGILTDAKFQDLEDTGLFDRLDSQGKSLIAEDIPGGELRHLEFEEELEDGFEIVMRLQYFGSTPVLIRGTCVWLREDVPVEANNRTRRLQARDLPLPPDPDMPEDDERGKAIDRRED